MKRLIKLFLAILALPLVAGFSRTFFHEIMRSNAFTVNTYFLFGGFCLYCIVHFFIKKPMFLYTFGHELSHAVTAVLFGGKVRSFKATERGGSVATTKTNVIIELSPYILPLYALILALVIPLIRSKLVAWHIFIWYIGLVGFAVGMHIMMTLEVLKTRQPDIVKSGYLFSLAFIYLANMVVLFALLAIFSNGISLATFLKRGLIAGGDIYAWLWREFVGL
ncbi:MAG: hypothetical protein PHS37_02165 [Candidatus Omnitrophica bacterium]|nr:hypothetical protein [Candidatus Omnitrophota bacterium]